MDYFEKLFKQKHQNVIFSKAINKSFALILRRPSSHLVSTLKLWCNSKAYIVYNGKYIYLIVTSKLHLLKHVETI